MTKINKSGKNFKKILKIAANSIKKSINVKNLFKLIMCICDFYFYIKQCIYII